VLENEKFKLDVKGSGWLAEFPSRNMTVEITDQAKEDEIEDEAFELRADERPSSFDFLGPEIDSGFRIGRNAAADRFTASIELAYHLAEAAQKFFPVNSVIMAAKFSKASCKMAHTQSCR
jgi:hypothetical protein